MKAKKRVLLLAIGLLLVLNIEFAYSSFVEDTITITETFFPEVFYFVPGYGAVTSPSNADTSIFRSDPALAEAALAGLARLIFVASQGQSITQLISITTADGAKINVNEKGEVEMRTSDGTFLYGTDLKFVSGKDNSDGSSTASGTFKGNDNKVYAVEVTSPHWLSSSPTAIDLKQAVEQAPPPQFTIFIPEPPTYILLYVPPKIPLCTPQTEVCDGKDNDCNSKIDDYVINDCKSEEGLCAKQLGVCKGTRKKCNGLNNYQDCTTNEYGVSGKYQETETQCDNLDNDCDGSIDEGCGCLPASTKPCGYNDKGICQLGTQVCSADGKWGDCIGAVYPDSFKETACDGLDNDCDGLVDECVTNPCGECGQLPTEVCNYQDEDCNAEPKSPTTATFNGKFYQDFSNYCPAGTVCKGSYADGVDNNNDGIVDENIDENVKSKPNNNYQSWCETCAANQGQACGNCGTIDCGGNCVNQGVCSPNSVQCSGDTTQTCAGNCQWQSVQNCNNQDGWYGGGNTQQATCGSADNDASSDFRDYGCSAGSCSYSITQTKDCDSSDAWYGGGNNAGCGTDPNSVWNDYYVTTNTNSCTSTTACTGTGSVNCDSSDVCNNKCEGTIFTSVPPMKDYYVATNTNSCTSTTDSPVTEDCATKSSTDSDGSATAYTTQGTVVDYTSCTLSGCGSNAYNDACSGTTLTEYGASGSSFVSGTKQCQDFETFYCSGTNRYRQEWGCSSSPGYCNDAAVADILIEDCNTQDGWYCNGATREYRDYGCAPSSCTYTVASSENCAAKASTDTDGSAAAYTVGGTVTDYVTCSAGSCTSNSYNDACSATMLTEHGTSGASFVSNSYNCENLESNYCSGDRYFRNEWACTSSPGACTDAADTAIGTNADGDAKDLQCGDSLCDNAAGVYDSTKTATETNCADGLDNDCDGTADCSDTDCNGSIAGSVRNSDNQAISSADVSAMKDLSTVKSATTNSQGSYSLGSMNCGAYDLVASYSGYQPQTKSISLQPNQQLTADFTLALGTSCEQDCTFAADEIVHASCDGKNGCAFYDSISKAACDNSQPGWVRDYNSTHYVVCAPGAPQPKLEIEASVSCASGTLVKITRIVVYNGKPVKLTVATCG